MHGSSTVKSCVSYAVRSLLFLLLPLSLLTDRLDVESYENMDDLNSALISRQDCQLARRDAQLRVAYEALRQMLELGSSDPYAIVGRDADGHPLNADGVVRTEARAVLAAIKPVAP